MGRDGPGGIRCREEMGCQKAGCRCILTRQGKGCVMGQGIARKPLVHEAALEEQLVVWLSTPPEMREHRSLQALADSMGVSRELLVNFMGNRPGIGYRVLKHLASFSADSISPMLEMLREQAVEKHNVRAAEVALEFLRKTLSDEGRFITAGPKVQVNQLVTGTADAARALLAAAQALGGQPPQPEAPGRRASDAVDTTYEVIPPPGWRSPLKAQQGEAPPDPSDAE